MVLEGSLEAQSELKVTKNRHARQTNEHNKRILPVAEAFLQRHGPHHQRNKVTDPKRMHRNLKNDKTITIEMIKQ
jgi:hypothetical protein